MPMTRKLRVDFFHVERGDGHSGFQEVLVDVAQRSVSDREREPKGVPVRLEAIENVAGRFECQLVRIRMDYLPAKVGLGREGLKPFDLRDDEGVAEESAFLYLPDLDVLLLQNNWHGASASLMNAYFNGFIEPGSPHFLFSPIIDAAAQQRLTRMQDIRTFTLEVAKPSGAFWREHNLPMRELASLASDSDAQKVMVTLKMGHKDGSMNKSFLKNAAKRFLSLGPGDDREVTALKVGGKMGPDETVVLDLLHHRMSEKVAVEGDDRRVPYSARRNALRTALVARESELMRLYGRGGD